MVLLESRTRVPDLEHLSFVYSFVHFNRPMYGQMTRQTTRHDSIAKSAVFL